MIIEDVNLTTVHVEASKLMAWPKVSLRIAQISMDGRGCWRDNVFVERFWKNIKYEEVYLHAYEAALSALRTHIKWSVCLQLPSRLTARRQNTARRHLRNELC